MDKESLLERIGKERARLEETVARLSDEQLEAKAEGEEWSGKDLLAHIAAWEHVLLARLEGRPDISVLRVERSTYEAYDMDVLNQILYRRHRDLPLADVRAMFWESHASVMAALERLSDVDLSRPAFPGDPKSPTLLENAAGNTFEHYGEHLPAFSPVPSP